MKRIFLLIMTVFILTVSLQAEERIAILPFTGIPIEQANLLANMVGNELKKVGNYKILLRTSAIDAALKELNTQRKGFTDTETIAKLGEAENAQFVVSGHVQKIGTKKIVSASIIDVETFQQISGDYFVYNTEQEVVGYMPLLAKMLLMNMNSDYKNLPILAVFPFNTKTEASILDRDVLAQVLAIEVANTGKYAVVARTATLESVMKEHNIQRQGFTDKNTIAKLGKALNADYVLLGDITKYGSKGYVTANIIGVESIALDKGSYKNEYDKIESAINNIPNISHELTGIRNNTKSYYLTEAVYAGDINMTKMLIAAPGTDVNFELEPEFKHTALTYAVMNSNTEIVKLLITAGANIDGASRIVEGVPAHLFAIGYDNVDLIKILMKAGVDYDYYDYYDENGENQRLNPLYWAVAGGCRKSVLAFIEAGISLYAQDEDGYTPLTKAIYNEDTEIALALIKAGCDLDTKPKYDSTALLMAIENENIEIAVALIKAGANLWRQNEKGETALMIAIEYEYAEIIKAAIEMGDDLNSKNEKGETALMIAIDEDNSKVAIALIKAGADLEVKNYYGATPLLMAVENDNMEITKSLIESGSKLDVITLGRETALEIAVKNESPKIALALIEAGSDPNTLYSYLASSNNLESKYVSILAVAIDKEYTDVAIALIEAGADLHINTRSGIPLLISAISNGQTGVSIALIEAGAPIDDKDGWDATALMYATSNGEMEIVKLLIAAGTDVNAKDKYGRTALTMASDAGYTQIANILRAAGAYR